MGRTDPLGYADCLSELNQAHGGKVVPLVKLLKHWRDVQMERRRPKSYWLECMIYHRFSAGQHGDRGALVRRDMV